MTRIFAYGFESGDISDYNNFVKTTENKTRSKKSLIDLLLKYSEFDGEVGDIIIGGDNGCLWFKNVSSYEWTVTVKRSSI